MSSKEKIIAYLKLGKSNKEIAELCNVSVRTVERHKKSLATSDSDTKNDKRQNRKIAKETAKILVEEGATIREVSDKVGLPRSTVGDISSKENLQQTQLENLKKYKELVRERIRANKDRRLMLNNEILNSLEYEITNWRETGSISKATIEKLILSEEMEQKILELDRIERMENQKEKNNLEMNKFLTAAKLKMLELVNKDNDIDKKEVKALEEEMDNWTLEVWGNEE